MSTQTVTEQLHGGSDSDMIDSDKTVRHPAFEAASGCEARNASISKLRGQVGMVIADDDSDDRLLLQEAFAKCAAIGEIHLVADGEELLDYLLRRGDYEDLNGTPLPGLILLDLNMPRKPGSEVLQEIKRHPGLRKLPVVVLTTSVDLQDRELCYELGANSFVSKPMSFRGLVKMAQTMGQYWFDVVSLPGDVD